MPNKKEEPMTANELTIIGLLLVIASQTTYTSYRTLKGAAQDVNDAVFVDTSVLMDGRIVAIAQTGFIPGKLVIPRSVVGELQFLADNADSDKRTRARGGLDVVKELQSMDGVTVELLQDGSKADEGVDERLLNLAKKHGGSICTIDFNLNKVAQVEAIRVLNVNELAKNLRMSYLPGDTLSLELTTHGSDSHQAVGHLDDGTMVVVEQARKLIGQTRQVEIIRSLQTAAGRMMFAKLASTDTEPQPTKQPKPTKKPAKRQIGTKPKPERQQSSRTQKPHRNTQDKPAPKAAKSTKRPARRKRTNEDRLISLVNDQD